MKKMNSKNIAVEAARIARSKKSKGVIVLDVRKQSDFFNYFTIATVESSPQMDAVENEIISSMKEAGVLRASTQQMPRRPPSPSWRIIDYGGTIVHIMTPEARTFYSLEKIMHKANKVKIKSQSKGKPRQGGAKKLNLKKRKGKK